MMVRSFLLSLVVVAGCARADAEQQRASDPPPTPAPSVARRPAPKPAAPDVRLTSVTLADDCGGTAPRTAPAPAAPITARSAKSDTASSGVRAKRRCEQTSMQLSITPTATARLEVKSVELFDERGASLGKLPASKPTRWSPDKAVYEAWDETLPATGEIHVSYVLGQPDWARIGNRWNRTYTVKTVLRIGGADRSAQKDVTLTAPAALPPNVKT